MRERDLKSVARMSEGTFSPVVAHLILFTAINDFVLADFQSDTFSLYAY